MFRLVAADVGGESIKLRKSTNMNRTASLRRPHRPDRAAPAGRHGKATEVESDSWESHIRMPWKSSRSSAQPDFEIVGLAEDLTVREPFVTLGAKVLARDELLAAEM